MNSISSPNVFHYQSLNKFNNLIQFSTTREGGCSSGTYDSFNLSYYSGDNPENVKENREKLCNILQLKTERLFVPYQTHQTEIAILDEPFLHLSQTEQQKLLHGRDALLTSCKNTCIAVTTADCVPILLYAGKKEIIGAVHAGWRGSCERILEQTIRKMIDCYACDPAEIHAVIGPSISGDSFEVGNEVYHAFEKNGFDMSPVSFKHPGNGKYHIDLWEINRLQLINSGVPATQIEIAGICTLKASDRFFSARKLGVESGRFLTGICLL